MTEVMPPTRLMLGASAVNQIGRIARQYGTGTLIVTGRSGAVQSGALRKTLESLSLNGVQARIYASISPNPRASEVEAAVRSVSDFDVHCVVGLGGGSAIDAAKVCAWRLLNPTSVADAVGTNLPPGAEALPVIAVPLIAGSGAEVTRGAILLDEKRGLRAGVRGSVLFPAVALVDPNLTASVPTDDAQDSAFDAFAHAFEGFVSMSATPQSRQRSLWALQLLVEALPAVFAGSSTTRSRLLLSLASVLGGINVATVGTCLPHRLQQALSGTAREREISHGRCLALLYPAWLDAIESNRSADFDLLQTVLGSSPRDFVARYRYQCYGEASFTDWGIGRGDIDACISAITGNLSSDPTGGGSDAVLRILTNALS